MARNLSVSAAAEAAKTGGLSPQNLLKIEFGGTIGTKWYADQTLSSPVSAEGRVIDWSGFSLSSFEDKGTISDLDLELADTDGTLLGYLRSQDFQGISAKIYQWFSGLLWGTDEVLLLSGAIRSAEWRDDPPRVRISISDLQGKYQGARIGTEATRALFPSIKKEHEGRILPLVIGHIERGQAVQVVDAKRTTLSLPFKSASSVAIVDDSRDFVQGVGSPYSILLGMELVRGYFVGRKLTLTQRGLTLTSGWTSAKNPNILTFRANLSPQGPSWIGYRIRFYRFGNVIDRQITNFTSPDVYGLDAWCEIPAWTYFEIYGRATNHDAGESVREKIDAYKWIICDAPAASVDRVEIKASLIIAGEGVSNKLKNVETWVTLDGRHYSLDLDDATWAGTIGHNVTSISMSFDPESLPNTPYLGEIKPTLTGVNYSNPTDIIVYLAGKLGFTYPTDFDTTTETAVNTLVSWLSMGFTLSEKKGLEILYEIAFQARISLAEEAGKFYFRYLQNAMGASVATIADAQAEIDSLEIKQFDSDEITNRIRYSFFRRGEKVEKIAEDTVSQGTHGVKEKDLSMWAHQHENTASAIASFWLRRWANATEIATVSTFLTSLASQRYDWVTLNLTSRYASQPAEIQKIEHIPGAAGRMDRVKITARVPVYAGCATTCELFEETGCASTCEQCCQTGAENSCGYSCETATQEACSLACVSTCELECTSALEMGGGGCSLGYETGCADKCEVSNETSCAGCTVGCQQNACEFSCQVLCEGGACQLSCVSATETTCGQSCEIYDTSSACGTSCEVSCTAGCTATSCQTGGCEATGCQGACEATGCTAACELSAQEGCTYDCQALSCRATCTTDAQISGCATSCTITCEQTCRAQCEQNCTSQCQADGTETSYDCLSICQTGCVQNCETIQQDDVLGGPCYTACQTYCETQEVTLVACHTSCVSYCMTAPETGCGTYCTVGCECYCQANCQSQCVSETCQVNCECACQTAEQAAACNTGSEGGCYYSCQAWEQTGCNTGCQTGCQAYCMAAGCETGCEIYCTVGCRCNCEGNCEVSCRATGCEINCQCGCQSTFEATWGSCVVTSCTAACTTLAQRGGCVTSCQATCTTQCREYCETACTASLCQTGCQSFCQTGGCEIGCEIYCTVGCRCECQANCQVACRSGCEISCTCLCQTAAQV